MRRLASGLALLVPVLIVGAGVWVLFIADPASGGGAAPPARISRTLDAAAHRAPPRPEDQAAPGRERLAPLAAAAGAAAVGGGCVLRVSVADQVTGAPLAGAEVAIAAGGRAGSSRTDDGGTALFESVAAGTYRLRAGHGDYADRLEIVEIDPLCSLLDVSILLSRGTRVEGRVVCAETGAGLAAARVEYFDAAAGVRRSCECDERGFFLLSGLPAGAPPRR